MSIKETIISKALEFENVTEDPEGSNNVIFNTHYYDREVSGPEYPWCVTFLWDIFRMCGASHIFCDGLKTPSTETVYDCYDNGRLFDTGERGDFILILTDSAEAGRRVNHIGLVLQRNSDGSYKTIEGNTGGVIHDGGAVLVQNRRADESGYEIVAFARPDYGDSFDMISITATLTVVSQDVEVRHDPSDPDSVFDTLEMGRTFTATARTLIDGDPFFYAEVIGWVDGKHVQGWVKDYNDNNRWWYVEDKYSCPASEWKTIDGKDYCFGADGYLFVYCYIKSEVNDTYYWVDDDGVWQTQYDTANPESGYRVVENYKIENAYQG